MIKLKHYDDGKQKWQSHEVSMNQQLIKWLPYPEYKPSNGRPVLVTYNWKGYIFDEDDFEVGIGEYWDNGSGFGKWDKYVTAFTTLPQPYNVEENIR